MHAHAPPFHLVQDRRGQFHVRGIIAIDIAQAWNTRLGDVPKGGMPILAIMYPRETCPQDEQVLVESSIVAARLLIVALNSPPLFIEV